MSSYITDIRYSIKTIANGDKTAADVVVCTVTSVDVQARTCTVVTLSDGAELEIDNVQLQASVDDGFVIVPAVDSTVIVSNYPNTPPFIMMYSDVASVMAVQNQWTFNKGDLGGIPKVIPLTTAISDIQKDINQLKQIFNAWTPAWGDGGTALKTALTAANYPTSQLQVTQQADIEDVKVKH